MADLASAILVVFGLFTAIAAWWAAWGVVQLCGAIDAHQKHLKLIDEQIGNRISATEPE